MHIGSFDFKFSFMRKHIKSKPKQETKKSWSCDICGYIHEGEDLPSDFICPICKHGAKDFSKIQDETEGEKTMNIKGSKTEKNLAAAFAGDHRQGTSTHTLHP